jgi:hypothetical protein
MTKNHYEMQMPPQKGESLQAFVWRCFSAFLKETSPTHPTDSVVWMWKSDYDELVVKTKEP